MYGLRATSLVKLLVEKRRMFQMEGRVNEANGLNNRISNLINR